MSNRVSSSRCVVLACLAGLMLPAASWAQTQWTATVLRPGTTSGFGTGRAAWRDRQGGTFDEGLQQPFQWTGTAASQVSLLLPPGANSADVSGMGDSGTVGGGFIYADPNGYYAVFVWNVAGNEVSVIRAPSGFANAYSNGMGGSQQVGSVEDPDLGVSVPASWSGTTDSFVNLLPAGFDGGDATGTDGIQQGGELYSNTSGISSAALWSGTAASFVSLHPGGAWTDSSASGVSQGRQVGYVYNRDTNESHAVLWQGTPGSMIDLHPSALPGVLRSEASGINGSVVCGDVSVNVQGLDYPPDRACIWTGPSASSFVDLHAVLGSEYLSSKAAAVWTDGQVIRVVGSAYRDGGDDIILWTYDPCGLPITVPVTSDAFVSDRDGDMLRDSCAAVAPSNDCNNNGQLDSSETLVFTNSDFSTDSGSAAWSRNGTAEIFGSEGLVQLTAPLLGQGGSLVRPPLSTGVTRRLRAIFDFRIDENSAVPADGISFSLMDADAFGTDVVFGENGISAPDVLTVMFNTFENAPPEGSNSMYIRYGGADIAGNVSLPFLLADGNWHRAVIDLTPDGHITVKLGTNPGDLTTVFNNVQVPGYTPKRHNIGFGGRTGGFYSRQVIANVRLGINGPNDLNGNGIPDSCECPAASITTPPSPQTACPSGSATFTVVGSGIAPLTYQWRKGGTAINTTANPSASTATLTISNISAADVGNYDCIVANAGGCGAVISPAAALALAPRCSLADVSGTTSGSASCGDGTVDGSDFVAFINSFAIGDVGIDPLADVAGGGANGTEPDGTIDGTDFVAFINAFALGC